MLSRSNARARVRVDGCTHVFTHERMREYEHPRTISCWQERKRTSTHAQLPASFHGFMQTIMPSPVHAPLLSRLNTAGNTIKYCLQRRYSASCSDLARGSGRPERTSSKMSVRGGRRRMEIKQHRFDSYKKETEHRVPSLLSLFRKIMIGFTPKEQRRVRYYGKIPPKRVHNICKGWQPNEPTMIVFRFQHGLHSPRYPSSPAFETIPGLCANL